MRWSSAVLSQSPSSSSRAVRLSSSLSDIRRRSKSFLLAASTCSANRVKVCKKKKQEEQWAAFTTSFIIHLIMSLHSPLWCCGWWRHLSQRSPSHKPLPTVGQEHRQELLTARWSAEVKSCWFFVYMLQKYLSFLHYVTRQLQSLHSDGAITLLFEHIYYLCQMQWGLSGQHLSLFTVVWCIIKSNKRTSGWLTLTPCSVATCLLSTSSDLFPTRIFWTLSGAYCQGSSRWEQGGMFTEKQGEWKNKIKEIGSERGDISNVRRRRKKTEERQRSGNET